MNLRKPKQLIATAFLLALAACGGGAPPTPPPVTVTIGAAGGTVNGPSGATVVIPAGALAKDTPIGIAQSDAGAPALPAGTTTFGSMFAFTPHGTSFAKPVTMTVPFDPSQVPAGTQPVLLKTNAAMNGWEAVAGATARGNLMTAQVTGFSYAAVGTEPPLKPFNSLYRDWRFSVYPRDAVPAFVVEAGEQDGGSVDVVHDYGRNEFAPGGVAKGEVHSSADGKAYWVIAMGPSGGDPQDPNGKIGSISHLFQFQSFVKNAANAKLKLTVPIATLSAFNFNAHNRIPFECNNSTECRLAMWTSIEFDAQVFTSDYNYLLHKTSEVSIGIGSNDDINHETVWSADVHSRLAKFGATRSIWNLDSFNLDLEGTSASVTLKKPTVIDVDLSKVAVGQRFSLQVTVDAEAYNEFQGESFAEAFFFDPQSATGSTLEFSGLTPTSGALPPPTTPTEAPACETGTDPAAGSLQFSAPSYDALEIPITRRPVLVTRIGGSKGDVSALVRSSDGTAHAGQDYTAVDTVVYFADGDTTPRLVEVPLTLDTTAEPDKNLSLTLSDPRGCGALGAQKTAVLNILDNDRPLPPSGLDPGFGSGGKVTTDKFGGKNSAMALQKDGKIVMVGGSNSDFVLARYNADGSLDTGFGSGGKITTDVVGSLEEHANGVAIQPDGKIVVVGSTGVFTSPTQDRFSFALVRYNPDGSLDSGFGSVGKVTSGVVGQARALALQPDGKIVVVGDTLIFGRANDFSDFVVARYNADGSLDGGFALLGQTLTDIGGTNQAFNVALQADGKIVVSGSPIGVSASDNHTDIARYTASGSLDSTFDTDGRLQISDLRVGDGLAIQPDGKLVLVGNIETATPPATATQFAMMRLGADGSRDTAFGGAGLVKTAFAERGDRARSVALQADGKIVVAGQSDDFLFALARYNADGALDSSFRATGKLTIQFGIQAGAETVAIQPDGKIVLGGFSEGVSSVGYALARIIP